MKLFEAPELKITMFRRENILTVSGGQETTQQSALDKAKAAAKESDLSVFSFSMNS